MFQVVTAKRFQRNNWFFKSQRLGYFLEKKIENCGQKRKFFNSQLNFESTFWICILKNYKFGTWSQLSKIRKSGEKRNKVEIRCSPYSFPNPAPKKILLNSTPETTIGYWVARISPKSLNFLKKDKNIIRKMAWWSIYV